MDDLGFLIAAYTVGLLVIAGYAWLLARRLARARQTLEAERTPARRDR